MKKKTDLAAVKQLANAFLMMEPEETEFSPMIVKHPFTDSGIVGIRKADGSLAMGNIMENPDDLASWRSTLRTVIDGCGSAMQVAYEDQGNRHPKFVYQFPCISSITSDILSWR